MDSKARGHTPAVPLDNSAVVASSTDLFDTASALLPITKSEAPAIRRVLRPLIPKQLDGFDDLRIMHLQLEGQEFLILQRAFADNKIDPKNFTGRSVFLIGHVDQRRFRVILSKKMDDEDQQGARDHPHEEWKRIPDYDCE